MNKILFEKLTVTKPESVVMKEGLENAYKEYAKGNSIMGGGHNEFLNKKVKF